MKRLNRHSDFFLRRERKPRRTPCRWRSGANGSTTQLFTNSALKQLSRLSISADPDTDAYAWTVILQFADRFQLTLYDAAYLELAARRGLPLATLDRELRDASAALGIALLALTQAIERHRKNARKAGSRNWPQR